MTFEKGRQSKTMSRTQSATTKTLLQHLNDAEMRGWLEGCRFAAKAAAYAADATPKTKSQLTQLTRLTEICIDIQDNPTPFLTTGQLSDYVARTIFPISPKEMPQNAEITPPKQRPGTLRGPYTDGWADPIDCNRPR